MNQHLGELEQGIEDRKSFFEALQFVTGFIGTVLSVSVVVLIIYWAIKIPEKNINDLPIINAIKGDIRTLPNEPGGKDFPNESLAIYENIDGQKDIEGKSEIVVQSPVSRTHRDLKTEIRGDIREEEELVNLNDAIDSAIKQFSKEQSKPSINSLYLGSFDSYNQAKSFWNVVQKKNQDILKDLNYKIYENNDAGSVVYRLQLENLHSKINGKNLCSILNSRQFACLLVDEYE